MTPAELPEGWELRDTRRVAAMLGDGERNAPLEGLELLDASGKRVAHLEWHSISGEIIHLWVDPHHQRQGLATRLYRRAQGRTHDFLQHSEWRTCAGEAWAQSLGEELPRWRLA